MCIEKLSEKARGRNPDEFYHKMVNSTVKDGEHHTVVKGGPEAQKRRKLEENQDIALVNLKKQIESKRADKVQSNLHLIDFPKQNQHIFFVSDPKEVKAAPVLVSEEVHVEFDGGASEDEDGGLLLSKYAGEKSRYVE